MKTAIIYESWHHGNTKKLCDTIAAKYEIDLIDAKGDIPELTKYDLIGVASGIAYGKFYKEITEVVTSKMPENKNVFLIYTCGKPGQDFAKNICEVLELKECRLNGTYCCKGYDTYGPLKLFGGLNKENPTEKEIQGAVDFFTEILNRLNEV